MRAPVREWPSRKQLSQEVEVGETRGVKEALEGDPCRERRGNVQTRGTNLRRD